ncbi:uncharacterized protein LOC110986833 [Acanthaster planci]|uniref:Uncharacterized protein LOC110986833 n=1 Tax=Acanthaster planci TaxID=133434 RepID=A0A8B7ZIQ0_ACAPL|nr:uncharacterized protein LOC110986833 [Acanthaster planci]XP_022104756.1 uncharacterized protein LOC110986833 [Acanthaster planci]
MSRATVSKSRADKSKDKDKDRGGSTSVPVPPVNTDVIPGRFSETDWGSLLDKEDGEDFIVDIVGDIVNSALHVIHENYIQRQLYPYTVTQARDAILQIIEWQFLARDEGEEKPEENFTWQEEEEPQPSVPDAWAQGSVPRQPQPPLSPPASEPDTDVTSVSRLSEPEILEDLPTTINETGTIVEADDTYAPVVRRAEIKEEEVEETREKEETMTESEKPVHVKPHKFKYKPYRGPLKSAGLRGITKTLDETDKEIDLAEQRARDSTPEKKDIFEHMPSSCHSILKVQAGRPPGSKDVTYDEKGNVVSVIKLDPERLPSHRVRTKFAIVDPAVEAAHARLIAMRTGRYISGTDKVTKTSGYTAKNNNEPTESVSNGQSSKRGGQVMASAMTVGSSNTMTIQMKTAFESNTVSGGITPLPPPLIESMELSPGVVVKEGNRIKRGPKLHLRHGEAVTSAKLRSLRPIGGPDSHGCQKLTVEHILSSQSPILRPLHATEPIPPIVPRPSNSAQESAV